MSTIQTSEQCIKEVKNRVQIGGVRGNECQGRFVTEESQSKSERKGLQDGCKTCSDVWYGDSGSDKKTGG